MPGCSTPMCIRARTHSVMNRTCADRSACCCSRASTSHARARTGVPARAQAPGARRTFRPWEAATDKGSLLSLLLP